MGLVALSGILAPSTAEVFTALVDLENVIFTESNMLDAIKMYIKAEEEKLDTIRKKVEKIEIMNKEAVSDTERYLGHPVNGFLLVKRFLYEWNEIENSVRLDKPKSAYLMNLTQYRDFMPDIADLSGAANALLRLQDTYRLETSMIANGKIEGTWTTPTLSAHECFELGRVAYNENDNYHTILWMKEAMTRLPESGVAEDVDKATILDYLAWAVYQEGNMKEARKYTDALLELDPTHQRALNNKAYFDYHLTKEKLNLRGDTGDQDDAEEEDEAKIEEEKVEEEEEDSVDVADSDDDEDAEYSPERPADHLPERAAYEALCRGEASVLKKHNNTRFLKCRYQNYGHPLLMIAPAKEEVIFDRPKLIMFREMLTNNEMKIIKGMAAPRLSRATIQNSITGKLEYADYRISKSAWLKPDDHPIIKKVRARVDAYSGLSMETAEDLQVVNYGIGGHYEPHFDFARKEEVNAFKDLGTGNRIATLLFYMSDVYSGGATVFPTVGARVIPIKGSAAFWFNLHPSGDGNYDTRHAACPVLAGTKWVSNIWIHEYGQEFRRRCDINPDKY